MHIKAKIMKKLIIPFLFVISPLFASSNIGLGVSLDSNNNTIYMPYDLSETIRIEPSLSYNKSSNNTSDTINLEVALGLFGKQEVIQNINTLIGLRVGYIRSETDYSLGAVNSQADGNGYSIAPTLGFEYYLSENFSVGAEASIRYVKSEVEIKDSSSTQTNSYDTSSTQTLTSASLRFYF